MGQLDFVQGGPLPVLFWIGYSFYVFLREPFSTPRSILVFGVLQLRVYRFRRLHSKCLPLKYDTCILQNGVCE
ncbi:hypothetical protein NA56DRAFT_378704 [Hyaloscypha hepaticicola]|uniref:Uncharacterized protein n=1 Tax=Hyaloscypha hepaticicola TaxID=2082293 RepID=A0A2J6PKE4_9HELO|nr:hypothetical protein NA56DRAFT_378704 [Hyaloscypha hepaticicola]